MMTELDEEGEVVNADVEDIGIRDDFLAVLPWFISPRASLPDLFLNFTIHHDKSAVSVFISSSTAAHEIPGAVVPGHGSAAM